MAKWTDYAIYEVCYNDDKSKILYYKSFQDLGDSFGSTVIFSRDEVIRKIEGRITFCTTFKQNSKWQKGEDVRVITTYYGKYLRTDKNNTPKDNLGNLPEFFIANNVKVS